MQYLLITMHKKDFSVFWFRISMEKASRTVLEHRFSQISLTRQGDWHHCQSYDLNLDVVFTFNSEINMACLYQFTTLKSEPARSMFPFLSLIH